MKHLILDAHPQHDKNRFPANDDFLWLAGKGFQILKDDILFADSIDCI